MKQIDFLITQIDRISNDLDGIVKGGSTTYNEYLLISSEALQLLHDYAPNTFFLSKAESSSTVINSSYSQRSAAIVASLKSFRNYITNGLSSSVSLERQAQIEVVNDFLEQAANLLNDKRVHPAAPIVLIGASLEEFIRNWCIDSGVEVDTEKGSLDKYAQALRAKELINKQDIKDITSWGGLRNDAAHGNWESVSSGESARIMLLGVNLFMRKYSPENR